MSWPQLSWAWWASMFRIVPGVLGIPEPGDPFKYQIARKGYWERVRYVAISDKRRYWLALRHTHDPKNFKLITESFEFRVIPKSLRFDSVSQKWRMICKLHPSSQRHWHYHIRDDDFIETPVPASMIENNEFSLGGVAKSYYWNVQTNEVVRALVKQDGTEFE